MTEATMGRRERKKARTRQAIADAALELFLERGYDQVSVKDVAEAADVSTSGLFKHFPTKEALVFDRDDDIRTSLVAAVRDRPEGVPPLDALRNWRLARLRESSTNPRTAAFAELVRTTPALQDYADRMWLAHERELAQTLTEAQPPTPDEDGSAGGAPEPSAPRRATPARTNAAAHTNATAQTDVASQTAPASRTDAAARTDVTSRTHVAARTADDASMDDIAQTDAAARADDVARANAATPSDIASRTDASSRTGTAARTGDAAQADDAASVDDAAQTDAAARADVAPRMDAATRADDASRMDAAARKGDAASMDDAARADVAATAGVAATADVAATASVVARAVARFALDRLRPREEDDPRRVIEAAFTLLAHGWPAPELSRPVRGRVPAAARPEVPAGVPGLRERKKAQTRRAITEAAVALFTERGYDDVGVREIADAADTSIATLFKYFPDGKASLVFPGDRTARIASLTSAVHDRAPGQTVLDALRDLLSQRGPFKEDPTPAEQRVLELVSATPDLRDYALRSWTDGQDPLAAAIAAESGLPADDLTARLLARYVLQIPDLARNTPDPRRTLDIVIDLLSRGWPACLHEPQPHQPDQSN